MRRELFPRTLRFFWFWLERSGVCPAVFFVGLIREWRPWVKALSSGARDSQTRSGDVYQNGFRLLGFIIFMGGFANERNLALRGNALRLFFLAGFYPKSVIRHAVTVSDGENEAFGHLARFCPHPVSRYAST